MAKKQKPERPPHLELVASIKMLGRSYGQRKVFGDFVEMAALSIANAVDVLRGSEWKKREESYLRIIKSYRKLEERQEFPKMLAYLTEALTDKPEDVLGSVAGELEMLNGGLGQFFTPYNLSYMMAKMLFGDPEKGIHNEAIRDHGFFTMCEPCCGAGGMVIAAAQAARDIGINYQQQMHVTAVDIDPMCVHMTYLQASLMHIPATIFRGNWLTDEFDEAWHTPAHMRDKWDDKLHRYGIDERNNAWWRNYNLEQRIQFLSDNGIDMELVASLKAPPEAIEARDRLQAAAE